MTADALHALRPELHRYCARLMGSVIDGEDVVQDAFIRVLATPPPEGGSLRAWLFRIAHNRAMDLLRMQLTRRAEPLDTALGLADDTAPDALDALMRKDAIDAGLSRFSALPLAQRSAVILKDVLDEPLYDIAELLDVSVDAVKGLLARGRARLEALREAPSPSSRPLASPETMRFIALFNDRDWDALRALLAADAKLQQSTYPLREGPSVRDFFGIYASYDGVRLAPAWLDDREVIAVFEGADRQPRHIMWLEWQNGALTYIRDYRYVAYVIAETRPYVLDRQA